MGAPSQVLDLMERFERHNAAHRSSAFGETQTRQEFINPLFKALGWDIDNEAGLPPTRTDVIHEYALKVRGSTEAPDYCFRLGGHRKFFVEAKKPATDIEGAFSPAFQLRRYGWSAKLPLSILTDFEEFAVYDCRVCPAKHDAPATARTLYLPYTKYDERWDDIASTFSKEAVLQGNFDRAAEAAKTKKGTLEVDAAFLKEIEEWRNLLARTIALRNPSLTQRELNYAVQVTIDRIIFLRICEDRGIEDYGELQSLCSGTNAYSRLLDLYRKADQRYNSGLFHFGEERGRAELPDRLTPILAIDDGVLKAILKRLYYPDSPYEFSVLPADILGQVYEQFLGKVIRLTAGHHAKVEDKPEVKKAGGVYYTPTYIVDYIVKNTVGKLLEGSTPKKVSGLHILDPACGSGSFLIGAFQYLVDWHRDWYVEDGPRKHTKEISQAAGGEWRLTTTEKKRVLLNNIYGVDIDSQAVETTKLSLLLKVLEGETQETINAQLSFLQERALPDLANNVKCGNSLIRPDFYQNKVRGLTLFDAEQRYRINVFAWEEEFPKILGETVAEGQRGFDAVIGNPPYIFTRELLSDDERQYFSSRYDLSRDKHNTYILFMELILRLLAANGRSGFIVPNSWLTIESASILRKTYAQRLLTLADLNYLVFKRVAMEPCVFIISGSNETLPVEVLRARSRSELDQGVPMATNRGRWLAGGGRIVFSDRGDLEQVVDHVLQKSRPIGAVFDVRSGLQAYERGRGTPPQSAAVVANHVFDRSEPENEDSYRYLQGKDVRRHDVQWSGMWMQYGPWLSQPRELSLFTRPRVLLREITAGLPYCLLATFVGETYLNNKSILNVLHSEDDPTELMCLAGVLNSKVASVFYKATAVKSARRIFPKVVAKNLAEFPYPVEITGEARQAISQRVSRLMQLHSSLATVRVDHDRRLLDREVAVTSREIDRMVGELFGLTDDEMGIIEASSQGQ